jgi:hypothetical protein
MRSPGQYRHPHRSIPERSQERPWSECVTAAICKDNPLRKVAHGGVVREDVCACGATRLTEVNANRKNVGAWREAV